MGLFMRCSANYFLKKMKGMIFYEIIGAYERRYAKG